MKLIKLLILLSGLSIVLSSCGSLGQASKVLRNEKVSTTDEFLIKKRGPLTQPPDFRKIPEPESLEKKTNSDQNNIEKILKKRKTNSSSNQTKSSTTEDSILKQIQK
jgi:hypothetical protein|tara:strand:- start:369 stop:689 length:321 start_codon:yes stop_codon:yes gene_type:complete